MCLLLFSGLLWHLAVVPAVVACRGGLCSGLYQGQFRSLILCMALVYPCSYSGAGEYKADRPYRAGSGLACCRAPVLHNFTHTPTCIAQQVEQPKCYKALEPDATHAPVCYCYI